MSLDAKFELRIDGGLVMEIRVHPKTAADAVADILEDAAATFREGVETMMTQHESSAETSSQREAHEPPPVEWRYFTGAPKDAASPVRQQLNYIPTRLKSTETH